ncbi:MAG TPA: CARDB domain-containing protein, partial [Candidatus Thermoplasmatota archaeon]|nr:CARDB domain-containing protein [Candidatus Thermoplasmatota archaeon]
MASPVGVLLSESFRRWMGSRGFVLVAIAALFPAGLTAAWMGTHQADVSIGDVAWNPAAPVEGENVTFTAMLRNSGHEALPKVNATLSLGHLFRVNEGFRFQGEDHPFQFENVAPGETRRIEFSWTAQATGQPWVLIAVADPDDVVGEVDEFNNDDRTLHAFVVQYRPPAADQAPGAPAGLGGSDAANATADLAIVGLTVPPAPTQGNSAKITATVANLGPAAVDNATVTVRVGRNLSGQFFPQPGASQQQSVSLAPGAQQTIELEWTSTEGAFWAQAYVNASATVRDPDVGNNHQAQPLVVQPVIQQDLQLPAPPDRLTIKQFYYGTLMRALLLGLLIPFIALFFAGGVLADDRDSGTLPYLLTRPIPRGYLVAAKFLAGFAVAAVAVVIGDVVSFALLFGAPGPDLGYLTTPLVLSLLALLVYGAFFTLLGTLLTRPYLVGLAFVLV